MANKKKEAAVSTAPSADVKPEVKPAAPAAKPAAKTAEKKKAAPKTVKATKEPAAKKTAAKADKPAAKTTVKAAAKTTDKPAVKKTTKAAEKPAKTTARKTAAKKSNVVTIDTICTKLEKKIVKSKASAVKEKIAVEIEVWGFEDGSNSNMYIEINDGKVSVAPYDYKEKDFRVSLSFANAVAFVDGKMSLKDLLGSKDFYADGNIAAAVKLAAVF